MLDESLTQLRHSYYNRLWWCARDAKALHQPGKVWSLLVELYLDLVRDHSQSMEGRWLANHLVHLAQQKQPLEELLPHLLQLLT